MIHLIPHGTLLITPLATCFGNCSLRSQNPTLDFDFQLVVLNDLTQSFIEVVPHKLYSLKFLTDHLSFH